MKFTYYFIFLAVSGCNSSKPSRESLPEEPARIIATANTPINSDFDVEKLKRLPPAELPRPETPEGLRDWEFALKACRESVEGYPEQIACTDLQKAKDAPQPCKIDGVLNSAGNFAAGYAHGQCEAVRQPTKANGLHITWRNDFHNNEREIVSCIAGDRTDCAAVADDRSVLACMKYAHRIAFPSAHTGTRLDNLNWGLGYYKAGCEDEIRAIRK